MADAICSSFGSKPLLKSSPFLSHYTSSRPFFLTPSISFQHSVYTKRERKRRPQLHFISLCTQNSNHFDVISTHEDSDGTFMFRFGDPSEVVRNDNLEEVDFLVEGKGRNGEEGFSPVNVIGSDQGNEVMAERIEGEEKSEDSSEVVDYTNSVIERESRSDFEIESSSGETCSSSSAEVQVLVSSSSLDTCDSSEITEQVDGFLHRMVNIEELNDLVSFDVEDSVHVDGSIELNGSTGSFTVVEHVVFGGECLVENDNYESPCPSDNVSGPEDPNVDQREASLSLSPSELGPDDHESRAEIVEPLTGRNQELVSEKLDPVIEVIADDVVKETSQENIEVGHVSNIVDFTNDKAKTQNKNIIGDSGKREMIEMLSLSLPLETEPALHEEGNAINGEVGSSNDITGSSSESEGIETLPQSLLQEAEPVLDEGGAKVVEAGIQDDIMRVSNESEAIGTLPVSPPLEAEPFISEEGDADKVEGGTKNDIKGGSSQSEIILSLPVSPPVPDEEAGLERTEIFDESFRSGTEIMSNSSSEIMEVEVNKEISGTDDLVDSSDSGTSVSTPIILDRQSEKICLDLFLSSGTASLPHPEKALAGGEDACFTCQNWLGVADGVSHWSLEGVDHGKYAHEIMEIAREIVSGCCDTPVTSPDEVLRLAVVSANYPGSSTVSISHFDGEDLHVANIGDSELIILRNDAVCQRTSPMFHDYSFPVLVQREDDSSKLVELYKFNVDEGDIVVAASDGLFDNLYEQDIISIVSKSLEADKNPKEIAEILAMRAHEVGGSTRTRSPFSDAAQAAGYTGCTGGKLDDVVVVVSLVKKGLDSHAS